MMKSLKWFRVARLAPQATSAALMVLLAAGAGAAEPSNTKDASPAVSGNELENLNRSDATTAAGADARSETPSPAPSAAPTQTAPSSTQSDARTNPGRSDRLELDTTVVTGNRELPKVLYIVPWKKAQTRRAACATVQHAPG